MQEQIAVIHFLTSANPDTGTNTQALFLFLYHIIIIIIIIIIITTAASQSIIQEVVLECELIMVRIAVTCSLISWEVHLRLRHRAKDYTVDTASVQQFYTSHSWFEKKCYQLETGWSGTPVQRIYAYQRLVIFSHFFYN